METTSSACVAGLGVRLLAYRVRSWIWVAAPGLLGNPVNRVGRLLERWLGEQTPKRLCIVLVGVQQPIQPTVQQASGLKLTLLEIIPPKLERVNF